MASELRQAIRTLLRNPGFAISAIVILGLACAATTTIFSLAYGILLRDLPYGQPDRLVSIGTRLPAAGFPKAYAGAADYFDWRKRQQVFEVPVAQRCPPCNARRAGGSGTPELRDGREKAHNT